MGKLIYFAAMSETPILQPIPNYLKTIDPQNHYQWFVSLLALKNQGIEKMFNLNSFEAQENWAIDSGGYSLHSNPNTLRQLSIVKMASILKANPANFAVGPDVPSSDYFPFNHAMTLSADRSGRLKLNKQIGPIYEVIHGKNFKQRETWLNSIRNATGDNPYGIAVASGASKSVFFKDLIISVLHAWANGFTQCHVLGKSSIELLPLLVFLASNCFEKMSHDSTTFSVNSLRREEFVTKNTNGKMCKMRFPKLDIHPSRHFLKSFECNCASCTFFSNEYGVSLSELIKSRLKHGQGLEHTVGLLQWLVCHNVFQIQEWVRQLNILVKNETLFFKHLEDRKLKISIEAIHCAQKLISLGKSDFLDQLSKL